MSNTPDRRERGQQYLVGGGIASLAAAAYLIRDGGVPGSSIHIFEETDRSGGAMDGSGDAEHGYVIRGGRMLNSPGYHATWDLMSFIPSIDHPGQTVRDDVDAFNAQIKTHSLARLVAEGTRKLEVTSPGFSWRDRRDLITIMARSETSLGTRRIEECFTPEFFQTRFWYMWATTFAFQPWHSAVEFKRYLHRFIHEFPRIHTLEGVDRTPFNQYDSVIHPLEVWLAAAGVNVHYGTRVVDLDIASAGNSRAVERIHLVRGGTRETVDVHAGDNVYVTIGSMTSDTALGSNTEAPALITDRRDGAWNLWETIAADRPEFGQPQNFSRRVDESKWLSFTCTFHDPTFFTRMEAFSGNTPGTGALVTFKDSSWLMSLVLAYQPHYRDQPDDVQVCWGYGLFPDNVGDHVKKPMSQCTGTEILTEVCRHLRFDDVLPKILDTTTVIPCMLPYITAQFLTRTGTDRPKVVPEGSRNLAFLGQFAEIPDDVVFTVDYSVRSAQIAVYTLLGLNQKVTPIYKGEHDPKVLAKSLKTMFA